MAISERGSGEHGYALLVSAAPVSRYRVVDAAGALHQLAAVPPATLLGTATASVVQLADPVEPNTVLTHVRTAAAAFGPLLVYVAGQVTIDRRQRLPHLALARTSSATVRYTALPWHWLAHELRGRPPGSTTVLADLVAADAATWDRLAADPKQLTDGLPLYGTLAPPPPKRATAALHYSQALAEILRSSALRPPIGRLHLQAAAQAGIGTGEELLLGATHEGALAAVGPNPVVAAAPVPSAVVSARPTPSVSAASAASAVERSAAVPPTSMVPAPGPRGWAPTAPRSLASGPSGAVASGAGPAGASRFEAGQPSAGPSGAGVAGPTDGPAAPSSATPAGPPAGTSGTTAATAPGAATEAAPGPDPYAAIRAAARAGRHTEAAAIAAAWEAAALRTSGPTSPEAVHWVEVRADLAMLAGDIAGACALWMTAATARLSGGQRPDEEAVIGLVDRAHHCWVRINDAAAAQSLSADLLRLRRAVPGHRPGALDQLQQRVAALQAVRTQRGVSTQTQ